MCLKTKRLLPFLLSLLSYVVFNAQTLYWVGGSGNFSDPHHWSKSSGGKSAMITPNLSNDVIFDDNSGKVSAVINFVSKNKAHSVYFRNETLLINLIGSDYSELSVSGDFILNQKTIPGFETKLIFKSENNINQKNIVNFYASKINSNVNFLEGYWNLYNVSIADTKTVSFSGGNYFLQNYAMLDVGNFVSKQGNSTFFINEGVFNIKNKFEVNKTTNFTSDHFYLRAPINDPEKYLVESGTSLGKGTSSSDVSIFACPGVTLSSQAITCFGACDGKLFLNMDAACIAPSLTPLSIIWSTPAGCTSPTLTSLPGSGTYTINNLCGCFNLYGAFIFDSGANLIAISNNTNIAGQAAISFFQISATQPNCFGQCNGSIIANISGGAPPAAPVYTIAVNPPTGTVLTGQSPGVKNFTALCGGINTFSITDGNGCIATFTSNLAQPAALGTTTTQLNPNCFGASNGSFSVSPTGGTPNYTVVFSNSSTVTVGAGGTATIGSLPAGAISATVTDSKGCTTTVGTTITQPSTINITPTHTNILCGVSCVGAASVVVTGGGGTYTYTWNPGPGSSAGITNLCAGGTTVTIQDNLLCTTTQTFNISAPTPIVISPTLTQVSCNGLCNGTGSVTATGGTAPITFTWVATGNTTISTSASSGTMCPGDYTVFAKDASNCIVSQTFQIIQPPSFTVTTSTQSITCFGFCNGSAVATPTGGNGGPFTFTWTPAPPSGQSTGSISNSCVNNYTVSIKDASNCPTSTFVSITQPTSITLVATTGSVLCNGLCTGSVNPFPSGGNAPYSYTLSSSTTTLTSLNTFTGLCAGNYTLLVKDASTCTQTFAVNILQPNLLVPSISTTSITCFNVCNGVLAGSASGGTPSYTLTWNTPTGTVSGVSLSSRCAGNYTLNIIDGNGCTTNTTTTLSQPSDLTVSINSTSVLCSSDCNGILSANVSGGTPSYTLNWSNGFNATPNTGLCVGVYTLITSDLNGCSKTNTAAVLSPSPVVMTQSVTATACAGSCDGSATVTASGGTPPFTFQFNTIPATINASGIIGGLCAGNYIASVTDVNGCLQSIPFSITSPTALSAAITGTQGSCGVCNGASTVTASNGTPGYTFVWTNSVNVTVSNSSVASALCPGNYTATVTDSKNCVATVTLAMVQTVGVAANVAGSGIQCFGDCTGSIVASPVGGTGPFTYTWSPTGQTSQTATSLCANIYTLTIKDAGQCINTATFNLSNPPALNVAISHTDATCFGTCNGVMSSTVTGGTGTIVYLWSPGGQTSSSLTNVCANNYSLTITDGNGCTTPTQTFNIAQSPSITASFTKTDPSSCSLNNGSICATVSGGTGGGYTYTWSPVAGAASCLTGLSAGTYSLIVADAANCTTTLSSFLTNPSGATLSINAQSVTCFGGNTGSATLTANGTAPFTFTWSPAVAVSNVGNVSTVSSLLTGTYNVSVTDGLGCISTTSVGIAQPSSVTANSTVSQVNCAGGICNGSITVSPTGGTLPYSFSWIPAGSITVGQNTGTVSSLCAGDYSLNLTNGTCVQTFTFNISQPAVLSLTNTSSDLKCNGVCNGSVVALASGGTAPISYSWTPVGGFAGAITSTIINLCANIYTVVAIDGHNCTATNVVQIFEPIALTSTLNIGNASCSNSCNASATYSVSGGTPTYSFSWSSNPATTQSLGGLCAGNYTATVTDGNGCISSTGFTVIPPPVFTATLLPTHPKCNAVCNGSITTSTSGAQGAVTFNWLPSGSGQNPVNLCNGNYTLTAVDANLCEASQVVNLIDPPAILANVTNTSPACNNNCDGVAISTPTNASAPISYTWLPSGTNSATQTNLCAGNYTVILLDANGCSDTQTFVLNNPPALVINPALAPATCGASNGSITAVVSGGTPSYTYSWASPIISTSSLVTGLTAGIYTLVVTDSKSCSSTTVIPLSNSNGPSSAVITSTDIVCNGQCTGAASIGLVTGGTPGYSVSWLTPPAPSTLNPLSGLCAGIYNAQVQDALSCLFFTTATISQPNSVNILPSMGFPTCNGICNGSISLNVSGGTTPYTFSWSPVPSATGTITNACAGDYTIIIGSTNNTCTSTQTVNLPSLLNMAITTSVVPNTCFGDCNGVATLINTTGGTPPYSINWNIGSTNNSISNLCNGVYSVTTTDANNCNNTFSVGITSPSAITSTSIVLEPSCNQCNGASTVTASGGSGASYTYSWTTGATTPTVANLCAGLYQVIITDGANCKQTNTIIINNSNGIAGEIFNKQDIQCAGICNGSATVSAIGGNPPIVYHWVNPSLTNSVITNLCAGTYFVQMSDAQGCLRTSSVDINATVSLTLAPTVLAPSCSANNGSINVIVIGGTPPYSYAWIPLGNTSSLTSIGAGIYSITVTDFNSCPSSQVFNLSNTTGPVVTFTQTDIACFNECTGAITAVATGTAAPFTFNWSVGGNTQTVTNLCKGIISLTVTDAGGCSTIKTFTLIDNSQLQINLPQVIQPTCNECNGMSTVNAFGGSPPYTYSWTSGATGNTANDLCAGLYQVLVKDALNCSQVQNVLVNNSNGITGEIPEIQDEICAGNCNGSATVTAVGGTSPISYNWISPTSTLSTITGLCAGTYFVQMTDSKGCIRTSSISINSATDLTLTPTVIPPGCGFSNGLITINVSGGSPGNPIFSWLPSGNTSSLSGIGAGIYTLTVTDPNGCAKTQLFSLNTSSAPALSFTQTNIGCFDACTGSIFALTTSSSSPFTYNWSVGGGNLQTVNNLCKGIVTLTVTDINGCMSLKSFTLTDNPKLQHSLPNILQPKCNGDCDGAITLLPSGGTLIYTYSWSPSPSSSNPQFSLCAGDYSVIVSDAMGCIDTLSIPIINRAALSLTTTLTDASCISVPNGSIIIVPLGGTPSYSYTWSGPSAFTSTLQNLSDLFPGTYTLSLMDSLGCKKDSVILLNSLINVKAIAGNDTMVCQNTLVILTGSNSIGAETFKWFLSSDIVNSIANTTTLSIPDAAGTSSLILYAISSVQACFDQDTVSITVFPESFIDAGPTHIIPVYSTVTIGGNPTSSGIVSYSWSPSFYLDNATVANPVASNTIDITYTITTTDENGCLLSDTMQVLLYPQIIIPNGFSPNGDGKNDRWIIDYLDQFPDNIVEVYNRWGELLFMSKGYNVPFDGRYHGKDLPVGTYYYVINLNHPAYTKAITGPLTIFR